jgi:hypothetical protein
MKAILRTFIAVIFAPLILDASGSTRAAARVLRPIAQDRR